MQGEKGTLFLSKNLKRQMGGRDGKKRLKIVEKIGKPAKLTVLTHRKFFCVYFFYLIWIFKKCWKILRDSDSGPDPVL